MAHVRVSPAPPLGVVWLLALPLLLAVAAPSAHAKRAPAAIDYVDGPTRPSQIASLEPSRAVHAAQAARAARGPLTAYGYGDQVAPQSGPTLDLRGAFADAPLTAPRLTPVAAPAAPAAPAAAPAPAGPLDISPPPLTAADAALLGGADRSAVAAAPSAGPAQTALAQTALAETAPAGAAARTAPPGDAGALRGRYLVQLGAFSVRANAERTRTRAGAVGAVLIDTIARASGPLYRVRVGSWTSRDAAEAARASVVELGFTDARVTQAD